MSHKDRSKSFKKQVTSDDGRNKRLDISFQIRKDKKESHLAKRRKINALLPGVQSSDLNERINAVRFIRHVISTEVNPPIEEVVACNLVPILVKYLEDTSEELQLESAWVLTNVASGNSTQTSYLVHCDAIPILVKLLYHSNLKICEQAIWALGNISGDNASFRDAVLAQNVLTPLLLRIKDPNSPDTLVRNAIWTLSNLCRGSPRPNFNLLSVSLPVLELSIKSDDREILSDTCWCISYLSDGEENVIEAVMQCNYLDRLVELLSHDSFLVQLPCLRCLGNFVSGNAMQTERVIQANAVPHLVELLHHTRPTIVTETCWVLSNIAAGEINQIQTLVDFNVFPPVISFLSNSVFDIKKECSWIISNFTSTAHPQMIQYLVSRGVIPPLCNLLLSRDIDLKDTALKSIENILKNGEKLKLKMQLPANPFRVHFISANGYELLQKLLDHFEAKIRVRATNIINLFFQSLDEESV